MSYDAELLDYLSSFLTRRRRRRFAQVLDQRTRYVTIALENLFHEHNVSAALRSCDCFGLQDVHVIESANHFSVNGEIALGADRWLTVERHRGSDPASVEAIAALKSRGYRVLVTSLQPDAEPLDEVSLDQPLVLVFGSEKMGVSREACEAADGAVTIPMFGFTESFNISVAVALCLYEVTKRLRHSDIDWRLPEAERAQLLLDWTRKSVPHVQQIERRFYEERRDARRA